MNSFLKEIEKNWELLKNYKSKDKTREMCDIAFSQNSKAIMYIPKRFKTKELTRKAFKDDWTLFKFVLIEELTYSDFTYFFKSIDNINVFDENQLNIFYSIVRFVINKEYEDDFIYFLIDSLVPDTIIERKYYIKEQKNFKVDKSIDNRHKYTLGFQNFDNFYKYLNSDLSDADIYDFDFKGIDLKKYNIENVNVSSNVLISQGLYDDTFFKNNIAILKQLNPLVSNKDINQNAILNEEDLLNVNYVYNKNCMVYYVSDIHLDYKIRNRFKEYATELEIKKYISEVVKKMLENCPYEWHECHYLIIAGDTCSNFYISSIFYKELSLQKNFRPENIICILGNHELWNFGVQSKMNVDGIIQKYKDLFKKLGITFLQNELLLVNPTKKVISSNEFKSMSNDEIKAQCLKSTLTIFGGIGFAGFNPTFNATNFIYNYTLIDIKKERQLSSEFFSLYKKLKIAVPNKNIIILSHMPKQDWSNDSYNPKWIYINGHTHINKYEKNAERTVYSNNQIGYNNEDIYLKKISFSTKCNIFEYYENGIYEISLIDYYNFYYYMGYSIQCNLNEGKIFMLKKNAIYMFIYQKVDGKLRLLNGGQRNILEYEDINYYYENLDIYAKLIKKGTASYYKYLNEISDYIKSFGGDGTIHGSIVDINLFSHVYVNVYDGTITPYYALSIVDKFVFPTLKDLLENRCPNLLNKYNSLNSNEKFELLISKNELTDNDIVYCEDTRIYKESRILKKVQYLIEENIVRIWKDPILKYNENIDKMSILEFAQTLELNSK